MTEMPATTRAQHFGSLAKKRGVYPFFDGFFVNRLIKRGPTGAGFELGVGREQFLPASGAFVKAFFVVLREGAGEGFFGSGVAQNVEGLRRQLAFPLRLGFDDFIFRGSFGRRRGFERRRVLAPQSDAENSGKSQRDQSARIELIHWDKSSLDTKHCVIKTSGAPFVPDILFFLRARGKGFALLAAPMSETVQPIPPTSLTDQNSPHPVLLLVNGNSRLGREHFGEAVSLLRENGVEVKEAVLSRDKAESQRLLQREIAEKARLVIIGGGDGTLSTCAEFLVGTDVAMGVLPMGTGNTFVRSLGLPVDLKSAIEVAVNGRIEAIDVGRCNGQVFLNSVSIGLSAEIAGALTGDIKKKLGLFAWPIIGGRVAATHRAVRLRLTSDKGVETFRTHQLMIANGRYVAGPIRASENASLQDHELTVFALGGASKLELVKAAWKWMRDSHVEAEEVPFFETKSLKVESLGRRLKANVDGDLSEVTPLELSVWSRALKVVVPSDFVADAV